MNTINKIEKHANILAEPKLTKSKNGRTQNQKIYSQMINVWLN